MNNNNKQPHNNETIKYAKFIYVNLEKVCPTMRQYVQVNQIIDIIEKGNINCKNREQLSALITSLKTSIDKKEKDKQIKETAIENSKKPLNLSNPTQRGDLWKKPIYKLNKTDNNNNNDMFQEKDLDNLPSRFGLIVEPPSNNEEDFNKKNTEIETANQLKINQSYPRQYNNFERLLKDDYDDENNNQTDKYILSKDERKLFSEQRNHIIDYICIDSKDRDFNLNNSPNQLSFKFLSPNFTNDDVRGGFINRRFQNVISIELVRVIIKNTNSLDDASDNISVPPYLILEIDEIDKSLSGSNDYLNKASFILDFYETIGGYRYYIRNSLGTFTHTFESKINLNKLTISLRLPNGDLYSFGSDNDTSTDTLFYLTFKITRLRKNLISSHLENSN